MINSALEIPSFPKEKSTNKFRSIGVTLKLTFILFSFFILLISGGLAIFFNYQTQKKLIAEKQQSVAREAASVVSGFIQEKFRILEVTSKMGNAAGFMSIENKGVLENLMVIDSSLRSLVLVDRNNKEVVSASHISNLGQGMLINNIDSKVIADAASGKKYIGNVYIDDVTSEPMILLAIPVFDVFKEFRGVLVAEVNLKFMWDFVVKIKIGESGQAYVVDSQGYLIAYSDTLQVLRRENMAGLKAVKRFLEGNKSNSGNGSDISRGIDNSYVVSTYIALASPDWAVVSELPVKEAYGAVFQIIGATILIIAVSLILAIFAGIYLTKRITKPIIELTEGVKSIGEGNLETKIEVVSNNEIGVLAASFNSMTNKLQIYYSELEQKIKEKTNDLQLKLEDLEKFRKLTVDRELKMIELKEKLDKYEKNNGKNS